MKRYRVHVKIRPWHEGGFYAEAPALQGCWVVSETVAQALADIYDGIDMSIESRLKRGEALPPEVVPLKGRGKAIEFELPVELTAG